LDAGAIRAVATLDEQWRRRLYDFARSVRRPVSREEAADAVGISRKLAAFHLDKLVDAGLLEFRFLSRSSPRVGRRPKVYELASADVAITLPARRYELLGEILVDALLAETAHRSAGAAALDAARRRGRGIGTDARERLRSGRLGTERALTVAEETVAQHGYEPERKKRSCVRLRNCPFHPMAQRAPDLVCGLNHALLAGLVEGLRTPAIEAVLAPAAGECCVELRAVYTRTDQRPVDR
jgi:predicted ArsR family transcriptional regulator